MNKKNVAIAVKHHSLNLCIVIFQKKKNNSVNKKIKNKLQKNKDKNKKMV